VTEEAPAPAARGIDQATAEVLTAKPETTAAPEGTQPKGLTAARDGQADDLKKIEGIGPALEKLCHELGIFHFDQIAQWGEAEIAWMDSNLKGFRGRVTRDKWVNQAKIIVTEGMDAFLERAKTNDY
jgi:NADH-quinone oxidoreductase subunit E